MKRLYSFGIWLYGFSLKVVSIFHPKAKKWVHGRNKWALHLAKAVGKHPHWIWFHCASLGEFEQGRPLLEALRKQYPEYRILVSFFSPSGFDVRKDYAHADYICYLPLDSIRNARLFVSTLRPSLAFFIKYELWIHFLQALQDQQVPTFLVSARLRPESRFFKAPMATLYRKAFLSFRHIFVQDAESQELLQTFCGHTSVSVSSDTRFDRVWETFLQIEAIPEIARFKQNRLCLIAGSTWPKGEALLMEAWEQLQDKEDFCMIIAPHEIDLPRIRKHIQLFSNVSLSFSEIDKWEGKHRILWIDHIGILAKLYHYADIAYVGGAWGSGLHNILEPAVFGCPILIGPDHKKFPEAAALIHAGGAFVVKDVHQVREQLAKFLHQDEIRSTIAQTNRSFIQQRVGASTHILNWLKQHGFPQKTTGF